MPKSQLEIDIEKATNENIVSDDWGLILDIIDQITRGNSEKEAIKIITRRLNDRDPHVIMNTLTLLNACMVNCKKDFKLVVCSRTFIEELKNFVIRTKFYKLREKLCLMIKTWATENEFVNDPELNLMPSLYAELVRAGVEFPKEEQNMKSSSSSSSSASISLQKKEEEDLARAIQLSIKESNAKAAVKQQKSHESESQKVKALYDFEAAEENELTFKAGDILYITDSSDQNWWKGYDKSGKEGLFPSNFVTSDLQFEVEVYEPTGSDKKVSFNNAVNINEFRSDENNVVVIDERKIDECIEMLQNADPTGEIQPDSQEMLNLEENCYLMGPLIDQQLQKIDQKHANLDDLNLKILEAFQLYNNLMKDSLTKVNPHMINNNNSVYNGNNLMSNYVSNSSYQSNPISFVTAPPQSDSSGHLLANQLNNFAPTSLQQQIPSSSQTLPNMMNIPYGMPATNNYNPNYNPGFTYSDNMKQNLDPSLQHMINSASLPIENNVQPGMMNMDPMLSMQYAKPPM